MNIQNSLSLFTRESSSFIGQQDQGSQMRSQSHHVQSTSNDSVSVTISNEAQIKSATSQDARDLIDKKGKNIYEEDLLGLKTYPENLASKLDDRSLSAAERKETMDKLQERENEAFLKYIKQEPTDLVKYFKEYTQYLDSLSPEDLSSSRYAGQREVAQQGYEEYSRRQGEEPEDLSFSQDPILSLIEMIQQADSLYDQSDLRDNYIEKITPILDNKDTFKNDFERALNRFDEISSIINEALQGDANAYNDLLVLSEGNTISNK